MMHLSSPIRLLIASNIILLTFVAFFIFTSFNEKNKVKNFDEINAQRINIIGSNGKPVLVLSNKKNMPGPSYNGKTYSRDVIDGREYFSGMIFFNELGDEVGGLIYAGIKKDSGRYSAVGHLSFDQFQQNQVLALDYNDNGKTRYSGMRIWDRPTNIPMNELLDVLEAMQASKGNTARLDSLQRAWNELKNRGATGVERLFIGNKNDETQIILKDKKGNARARLYIADTGDAKLEFLDEKGGIISVFPN